MVKLIKRPDVVNGSIRWWSLLGRAGRAVVDRSDRPWDNPDMIIAIHAGINVYGVRQWLARGMARAHSLMAVLAGVDEADVRSAHWL